MNKKEAAVVGIVGVALLILVGGSFWYRHWLDGKMYKVNIGLSEPRWPYRDRAQEELDRLFPQTQYADVPTRVTPEETYAKFRQGLKENNLEMVLEQMDREVKDYKETARLLGEAQKMGKFKEFYNMYPEEIVESWMGDTIAGYYYIVKEDGKNFRQTLGFAKDKNGDWKMKNL